MNGFFQTGRTCYTTKKRFFTLIKRKKINKRKRKTNDFSWTEVRPSPSGGIGGAAVEAPSANPISELCGGIICVDNGDRWLVDWGILTTIIVSHLRGRGLWMSHSLHIEVGLRVVLRMRVRVVLRVMVIVALLWFKRLRRIRVRGV